jgi:hypothetical protein
MEKKIAMRKIPANLEEMRGMAQFAMEDPFDTAALAVAACTAYESSPAECYSMLQALMGPAQPMSEYTRQFLRDRLAGNPHGPRSFYAGAVPGNGYVPSAECAVTVSDGPYSYNEDGYAKLWLKSSGADSPREVVLRHAKDGKWYLWGSINFLGGIRQPESENPWA